MLQVKGYDIKKRIYESAHYRVHQGYRLKDRVPVILKSIDFSHASEYHLSRLRYEYDILSRIKNKGIPAVYGLEEIEGKLLLIMEDIGGDFLGSSLTDGARIELDPFFGIAPQLAETLAEIHKKNVIHKRINPFNIIYNPATERVQIINFGFSSTLVEEAQEDINLDASWRKLFYFSPEQTGRMNRLIDYRTDLYSLGATFYELLTGRPPFGATDAMELIHHIIAHQPAPPRDLNPEIPSILADMILRLTAKNAEDRYQSAHGLKCDLEECRSQWVRKRMIAPFRLSRHDTPDQFRISQKLYGRRRETETLMDAFFRVLNGSKELVFVSGFSGIGKTSLVKELHKKFVEHRAYFIAGKSDPVKTDKPYASIIEAVKSLVAQLLKENEEQLALWKHFLLMALGPGGQVLIEVIPELELILGKQPPVQELSPVETQIRFHLLFQDFIQTITKHEHPLVLFLDDLQWADAGTLNLLKRIAMDPSIQYLLIIGTYREEEVPPGHALQKMIQEIQKEQVPIRSIAVTPLNLEEINLLIQDSFHCRPEEAEPFGSLIEQKTGGNPFFIMEFLNALHQEKMIHFDYPSNLWKWDIEIIRQTEVTSNVAELMTAKLLNLPQDVQDILKTAACCGTCFNLSLLQSGSCWKTGRIIQTLAEAVQENLIVPFDDKYNTVYLSEERPEASCAYAPDIVCKFSHDRIQQAAHSLLNEQEEKQIHLRIGETLREKIEQTGSHEDLFDCANHFNQAVEMIGDKQKRIQVARLNLAAGEKAKSLAAYETALKHFSAGVELLTPENWRTDYDLTFALYRNVLESEYLVGNFGRFDRLFQYVAQKAKTTEEKISLYNLKIVMFQNLGKNHEAVQAGIRIFKMLGLKFVLNPKGIHILWEIIKARLKYRNKRIGRLYGLPAMRQRNHQAIMETYSIMGPSTVFINRDLMAYTILKMLNLTLKYGHSNYAAYVYSGYGTILCSGLKAYESGYAFGCLGLRLAHQIGEKDVICKTYLLVGRAINHWRRPARENLQLFQTAYQDANESGNLIYSAFAAIYLVLVRLITGYALKEVSAEAQKHLIHIKRIKYEDSEPFFVLAMQAVKALEGTTLAPGSFSTDSFNEEEYAARAVQTCKIPFASAWYFIVKTQIHYLFGQYDQALHMALEAEKRGQEFLGNLALTEHVFYFSLTLTAQWHETDRAKRRKYYSILEKNGAQLKKWAQGCPANFQHKYRLVKAEMESIRGRHSAAAKLYDQAIAGSRKNLYMQNEAIAAECAARSYLRQGLKKIAVLYLREAHHLYLQWGASAKAKQLEKQYPHLDFLKPEQGDAPKASATGKEGIPYDLFDVHSIIKASQAISGEIVLNTLLEKMLKIIIENAGAQRGVFALRGEHAFRVEAEGRVDGVRVLPSIPIQEYAELPQSIINYVGRKAEMVSIGNAEWDTLFADDPYFRNRKKKSILCHPVMHQGKPLGLFYLENDLVADAFTPARMELLRLIANQAAISLENARLYEEIKAYNRTLAEKVEQRTLRLNQTVEQLKESKKAAEAASVAKSVFLANMSHEIRTPLNGILGMTELAMEKADDPEQKRILAIIDSEADALLELINDILDFSKIEAGRLELEQVAFDLRAMLNDLERIIFLRAKSKGLEFRCVLAPEIPGVVIGDPGRLRQILINLLGNALKFTSQGYVALRGERSAETERQIEIRFLIEDTGIGIPKDKQNLIFESFTQADGSTTRRFGGSGLGTTISKQLAECMGGKIGLQSEENHGSTFWFTVVLEKAQGRPPVADLPAAEGTMFAERSLPGSKPVTRLPAGSVHGPAVRVLLAEDYPTNQQVVLMYLRDMGCEVTIAENGQQAFEAFKRRSYDLIFMDVQMPVMDGYETTRAIRKWEAADANRKTSDGPGSKRRTPIVAMTAYAIKGDREQCLAAGMDDYLTKPFKKAKLLEKMKQWIPGNPESFRSAAEQCDSKKAAGSRTGPLRKERTAAENIRQVPLNVAEAVMEFEGNRELFVKIVVQFIATVKKQIAIMQNALVIPDADKMRLEAHSIKGGAANLTAAPLAAVAAELEAIAESGHMAEAADVFMLFQEEFQRLEAYVGDQFGKTA